MQRIQNGRDSPKRCSLCMKGFHLHQGRPLTTGLCSASTAGRQQCFWILVAGNWREREGSCAGILPGGVSRWGHLVGHSENGMPNTAMWCWGWWELWSKPPRRHQDEEDWAQAQSRLIYPMEAKESYFSPTTASAQRAIAPEDIPHLMWLRANEKPEISPAGPARLHSVTSHYYSPSQQES